MTVLPPDVRERLRRRDERTIRALVAEHTPVLFDWVRGFGVAAADRDDVVQEVWLRVLRHPDRYSGLGSFRGWLYRVARNVVLDRARSDVARAAREARARVDAPVASGPSTRVGVGEVEALLARLTERQRDVVMLRVLEGWSTADVARELGCAPGTVKATLSQSLDKLRRIIESESSTRCKC